MHWMVAQFLISLCQHRHNIIASWNLHRYVHMEIVLEETTSSAPHFLFLNPLRCQMVFHSLWWISILRKCSINHLYLNMKLNTYAMSPVSMRIWGLPTSCGKKTCHMLGGLQASSARWTEDKKIAGWSPVTTEPYLHCSAKHQEI